MSADIFPVPADILHDVHSHLFSILKRPRRLARDLIWIGRSEEWYSSLQTETEGEMSNGPGHYIVMLNGHNRPSLYDTALEPLESYDFETVGDAQLVFAIKHAIDIPGPFNFSEPPITWSYEGTRIGHPIGNSYQVEEENTQLVWQIQLPKTSPLQVTYQFTLWFNLGDVSEPQQLVSADGTPIDPTIVERPPEP